ncbi:hypothetical protein BDN72DRAFT_906303 [Pluteus cervinus]|uniref:Uncharacterized protein n=1 Tax=Pluteus cervinus TaxID=181527 RepID=A0ACD2ZZS2_9AGAR|nr:hypothetical protein BDN72DRAFT_906303 [Pluteus cervinus]
MPSRLESPILSPPLDAMDNQSSNTNETTGPYNFRRRQHGTSSGPEVPSTRRPRGTSSGPEVPYARQLESSPYQLIPRDQRAARKKSERKSRPVISLKRSATVPRVGSVASHGPDDPHAPTITETGKAVETASHSGTPAQQSLARQLHNVQRSDTDTVHHSSRIDQPVNGQLGSGTPVEQPGVRIPHPGFTLPSPVLSRTTQPGQSTSLSTTGSALSPPISAPEHNSQSSRIVPQPLIHTDSFVVVTAGQASGREKSSRPRPRRLSSTKHRSLSTIPETQESGFSRQCSPVVDSRIPEKSLMNNAPDTQNAPSTSRAGKEKAREAQSTSLSSNATPGGHPLPGATPHPPDQSAPDQTLFYLTSLSHSVRQLAGQGNQQSCMIDLRMKEVESFRGPTLSTLHDMNRSLEEQNIVQQQILNALRQGSLSVGAHDRPNRTGKVKRPAPEKAPKDVLHNDYNARIQGYIAGLLECEKGKVPAQVNRFLSQGAIAAVVSGDKRLSPTKRKWFLDWDADAQSEFNQIALSVAAAGFVEKAATDWKDALPEYASDTTRVLKSMVAHVKYLLATRKSMLAAEEAKERRVAAGQSTPRSFLPRGASPGPSSAGPSSARSSNLRTSCADPADESSESGPDAELERMTKLSLSRRRQRKKTLADKRILVVEKTPQLGHYLEVMTKLGNHAASSDESDHEASLVELQNRRTDNPSETHSSGATTDVTVYTAVRPAWRSEELTHFLWDLDTLRQQARFNTDFPLARVPRGNKPRTRRRSDEISHSMPPKGLPCNFYDEKWLATLAPIFRQGVVDAMDNQHDLVVPDCQE